MKNFGILLLAMVSCCLLQAKDRVVKQPPFIARSSSTIEIDRVVVSDTATVLDVKAFFRPHNWIQISNESYLLADNGEKYPIRSGNGIILGEKFWMPDSGEASFSLIFPLLPPTVKVIDFIESDCEDCFKVWGIHLDGKLPELDLSDDVKKQKLNYAEPLPKAELKDGKSVITGRLLDYEKHYALPFSCRTCDLLTAKFEDTEIKVNEDGTFRTEIELCAPTTVSFSVGRDIYFDVFLVPGGELDMAVNLRELSRSESKLLKGKRAGGKKVYFSGTMAALNDEMITDDEHLMDVWGMVHWNMNDLYNMTAGQYKAYWLKKYEETKSAICSDKKRSQAYRELLLAQNDLLCTLTLTRVSSNLAYAYVQCSGLPAREAYQKFKQPELSDDFYDYIRQLNILNSPVMLYANGYADLVRGMGYLRVKMDDELSDIFAFILSSDKVSAEDAKIIREFKADTDTGKTSVYQEKMGELRIKYDELFKEFSSMQQDYILKKIIAGYLGTDQGLFFDLQKMMKYAQKISDFTPLTVHDFEEIRKMSDPYYLGRLTKMNNRLLETIEANKKKKGYTVNESGEVKDEDLFYSIISKFKGKVILVDFWATWCGPCKMAMKQMKPMKKDLEGKDIVYVFIAGENSPKETWDNMIPDIHGEHYRVTAAQWKYLSKQFSIQGVPTYIIVDKEGAVIQKHTGFPGVDTVKKELMKALEK
jgi:thiol-disulfide isomerase/thioredoxin